MNLRAITLCNKPEPSSETVTILRKLADYYGFLSESQLARIQATITTCECFICFESFRSMNADESVTMCPNCNISFCHQCTKRLIQPKTIEKRRPTKRLVSAQAIVCVNKFCCPFCKQETTAGSIDPFTIGSLLATADENVPNMNDLYTKELNRFIDSDFDKLHLHTLLELMGAMLPPQAPIVVFYQHRTTEKKVTALYDKLKLSYVVYKKGLILEQPNTGGRSAPVEGVKGGRTAPLIVLVETTEPLIRDVCENHSDVIHFIELGYINNYDIIYSYLRNRPASVIRLLQGNTKQSAL